MKPRYINTPSDEFINNLEFEYIETYSFQRRADHDTQPKMRFNEYQSLKKKQESEKGLSKEEAFQLSEEEKFNGYNNYILNNDGELHTTAIKTGVFKKSDPIAIQLIQLLNTPIKEIPAWMCAPHYRDAIVFYDAKDAIINSLNVCLSCEYMETRIPNHYGTNNQYHINADEKAYKTIRDFFIKLGHAVEDKY